MAEDVVGPEQIIRAAVEHSPQLHQAGSEERAAAAREAQARATGRPSLSADAYASHYWGLESFQLGQLAIPSVPDHYNAGIQATQPLYTGGRIIHQQAATTLAREASQYARRGTEADVIWAATGAYWNWSKAVSAVDSFRAAVKRMEQHDADMRNEHKAGLVTESDALATTVQLENTRLQLAEAGRRVDSARAYLAYLMGVALPDHARPQVAASSAEGAIPPEADLLSLAHTNRVEAAARRLEMRAAEQQVEVARADQRPQFAAVARYEQARPNMLDIPPQDQWNYDSFVGVTASWDLFDSGLTRARVAEAAAHRDEARERRQQTDDQIALDVREARVDLANACERLTVAARAAESARRNLKVAEDLWKNGLTRHVDVLDAHARLTDAEVQVVVTRADVEFARAELEHATGKLRAEE